MDSQNLDNIRLENLRRLIEVVGTPSALAVIAGLSRSFLSQMTGPTPTRRVSAETAEKIETHLRLPYGFLSRDHETMSAFEQSAWPFVQAALQDANLPLTKRRQTAWEARMQPIFEAKPAPPIERTEEEAANRAKAMRKFLPAVMSVVAERVEMANNGDCFNPGRHGKIVLYALENALKTGEIDPDYIDALLDLQSDSD